MALSTKAQAIYDRLVETDQVNDWVGVAQDYITHKKQYQPGAEYAYDVEGFKERLKSKLIPPEETGDDVWKELAELLMGMAPAK